MSDETPTPARLGQNPNDHAERHLLALKELRCSGAPIDSGHDDACANDSCTRAVGAGTALCISHIQLLRDPTAYAPHPGPY